MTSSQRVPRVARRRSVARRMTAICAAAAMLLGGIATAQSASAASTEVAGGAIGPGRDMAVKSIAMTDDHGQDGSNPLVTMSVIDPDDPTGYVRILLPNGQCLTDQWTYNNPGSFGDRVRDQIGQTCSSVNTKQQFMIEPIVEEPRGDSAPGENRHQFRIVSATTGNCFFSYRDGLNGVGNIEAWDTRAANRPARGFIECGADAYWKPNAVGKTGQIKVDIDPDAQSFGVYNDQTDSQGWWIHWSWLLQRAAVQGAYDCASNGGSTCEVRLPGSSAWLAATDSAVTASGTQSQRLIGCGSGVEGVGNPQEFNNGPSPEEKTVASSITSSHQRTVSDGHTFSISAGVKGGVKDVWEASGSVTYTYDHKEATTVADSRTSQTSSTVSIPPYQYFMYAWTETVYTLEGDWKYGIRGYDSGYVSHVSSTYPASVGGLDVQVAAPTITQTKKSCLAGPAATNDAPPTLAASADQCAAGSASMPEPLVGTTVHACPGTWNIPASTDPAGSTDPVWGYQWYYVDAAGTATDIPGATRATFVIQQESLLDAHRFLGVRVWELGDTYRLQSQPAVAPATLSLHSTTEEPEAEPRAAASAAAEPVAASYVGGVLSAEQGNEVDRMLVADADLDGNPADGSGVDLAVVDGELPTGLSLDPSGRLTGTAATAGEFAFTVANSAGAGEQAAFVFTVHAASAALADTATIDAVAGEALAVDLVETSTATLDLQVVGGSLSPGITLDASTGRLTGTPESVGVRVFTVADAADPFAVAREYTLDVAAGASVLTAVSLADATVGEVYRAPLAASVGQGAVFGTPDDAVDLGGLWVDAHTGELAGTPTRAGEYRVTVTDITRVGVASEEYTIRVVAAEDGGDSGDSDGGSGDGGSSGDEQADASTTGDLAVTGADAAAFAPVAGIALALLTTGAVVLLVRRSRTRS